MSLEMSVTLRIKAAAVLWCHVLHTVSPELPEGIHTVSVTREQVLIENTIIKKSLLKAFCETANHFGSAIRKAFACAFKCMTTRMSL